MAPDRNQIFGDLGVRKPVLLKEFTKGARDRRKLGASICKVVRVGRLRNGKGMRDTITNRDQRLKIRSNLIAKGSLHKLSHPACFQVGGNVVFVAAWLSCCCGARC